jgi:hypothetical protein
MKRYSTIKQLRMMIREQLLLEVEPDEKAPTTPEDQPSDKPANPPGDENMPDAPAPKIAEQPMFEGDSLDIQVDKFLMGYEDEAGAKEGTDFDAVSFADNVANLVDKHEALLDIKSCIVRRCLNRVQKQYDDNTAKRVQDILDSNFELTPDNSNVDKYNDEKYPAPAADRAGPSLSGAGGGAGA